MKASDVVAEAIEEVEKVQRETTYQAFRHFFHLDHANAAIHCAPVRYSPLTFRLAEVMDSLRGPLFPEINNEVYPDVYSVLLDKGVYEEDAGR